MRTSVLSCTIIIVQLLKIVNLLFDFFFSDIKAEGLWDQMQSDAAAELDAKALEDFIAQ